MGGCAGIRRGPGERPLNKGGGRSLMGRSSWKWQQMVPDIQLDVFNTNSDGRVQTPLKKVGIHVPEHSGIGDGVVATSRLIQQVPPLAHTLLESDSSQSKLNKGLTQVPSHVFSSEVGES